MPLTKSTLTASFGDRQNHCHCRRRFGSTGRLHPAKRQRNEIGKLSHKALDARRISVERYLGSNMVGKFSLKALDTRRGVGVSSP